MARGSIFAAILCITLTSGVHTQIYDIFQALQPLVQSNSPLADVSAYGTIYTTKKPKTTTRHRTSSYNEPNRDASRRIPAVIPTPDGPARDIPRKREKQTLAPIFDIAYFSTTSKPSRKTNKNSSNKNANESSKLSNSRGSSRNTAREVASNPKEVSRGGNIASSKITFNEALADAGFSNGNRNDKSKYDANKLTHTTNNYESSTKHYYNGQSNNYNSESNNYNSQSNNYNSAPNNYNSEPNNYNSASNNYNSEPNNYNSQNNNNKASKTNNHGVYTTQNPFYNRPGVKPANVDDRKPPITNRPPTRKPSYEVYPKPTDAGAGAIQFPRDTSTSPELITAPDEDSMTDVERRRYIEISERMCDKFKSLFTKQLQAIPLVPSPEPVQINVTSCVPSNIPLVVGGKAVSIREFPHMALIGWMKLHTSGYAWRCGGSLVSNQFVLTAAHCAYDERDNAIVMGTPRAVQLGSSYLDDPAALVVRVSAVIRHPKYKQPKSYYDIALIKMVNTVTFTEVIKPACLGVPPPTDDSVIATGWGKTEFGGDRSSELRSVSIPVWDLQECTSILGKSRKLPNGPSSESQICAGERQGGKDTCQGDSGGPAQIQDGCVWRVVAVTSLGRSCGAPNTPAVYATVKRAFISSVVFGGQITSNRGGTDSNSRDGTRNENYVNNNNRRYNQQNNDDYINYNSHNNNDNKRYETPISKQQNNNYNQQFSNDGYNNNQQYNNQPST